MKCFYHAEADAVGTCKHCHRGVCRECAAEREGGIACRNRCEAQVDQVNALIQRNILVGVKARPLSLVALVVFAGAFFALLYLSLNEDNPSVRTMLYLLTAFCFVAVLGQLSILRSWLARRAAKERQP
jgi:hypothetical protein